MYVYMPYQHLWISDNKRILMNDVYTMGLSFGKERNSSWFDAHAEGLAGFIVHGTCRDRLQSSTLRTPHN
jgi:hypothetical protein